MSGIRFSRWRIFLEFSRKIFDKTVRNQSIGLANGRTERDCVMARRFLGEMRANFSKWKKFQATNFFFSLFFHFTIIFFGLVLGKIISSKHLPLLPLRHVSTEQGWRHVPKPPSSMKTVQHLLHPHAQFTLDQIRERDHQELAFFLSKNFDFSRLPFRHSFSSLFSNFSRFLGLLFVWHTHFNAQFTDWEPPQSLYQALNREKQHFIL
jgi:hypothetical protein